MRDDVAELQPAAAASPTSMRAPRPVARAVVAALTPFSERNSIAGSDTSTPTARCRRRPRSPPGAAVPGQADGLGAADDLEGVVDAAAGQLEHGGGGVVAGASTACVAPARSASSSFAGSRSTATISARAGEPSAGDDLLPDAAAADHAHRSRRAATPRGVAHRADARDHAAAEQRGLPQRHLGGSGTRAAPPDHAARRSTRPCGRAAAAAVREREPRGAVHQRAGPRRRPGRRGRPPGRGRRGTRRTRDQAESDAVARRDAHRRPRRRLDRPRALVAEHHRPAPRRRGCRRRDARRSGIRRPRRCAPAPRRPAVPRARPPRRRRRPARADRPDRPHATLQRLERVQVGLDAEARARRRRDRAVGGDLDGAGSSQSRRSADHAGGSYGTST